MKQNGLNSKSRIFVDYFYFGSMLFTVDFEICRTRQDVKTRESFFYCLRRKKDRMFQHR